MLVIPAKAGIFFFRKQSKIKMDSGFCRNDGAQIGALAISQAAIVRMASVALLPHITGSGLRLRQTAGRSGLPKIRQRL